MGFLKTFGITTGKEKKLKENGIALNGVIHDIAVNSSVTINGRNPRKLVCEATLPNGETRYFESGNVSVLEKGADDWHTYRLSDVLSAVRASESQADLFDYERKALFEEQLDGKELEISTDAVSEDAASQIQM